MKKLKKFTSIRICSKHFAESDYRCSSSKRYLKKDAFPTIFEQNSTSIIEHFVSVSVKNFDLKKLYCFKNYVFDYNYNIH